MKLEEIAKMAIDEVAMELKRLDAEQENLDASQGENDAKSEANLTSVPVSGGDVNLTNAAGLVNLVGGANAAEALNLTQSALADTPSSQKTAANLTSATGSPGFSVAEANASKSALNFDITQDDAATAAPQKAFEVEVANFTGEEIFLKNLKERVLVLFEGLNATSAENLQDRLSLTLKFLEFVLANVENRLENLQK